MHGVEWNVLDWIGVDYRLTWNGLEFICTGLDLEWTLLVDLACSESINTTISGVHLSLSQ